MAGISEIRKVLSRPILISLFDYSGLWSAPYRRAGYRVLQIDMKLGFDIFCWNYKAINPQLVRGILAALPCTEFSGAGSQYWKKKDKDGTTEKAIALVKRVLEIVRYFRPRFWVIENPVGRLNRLLPLLRNFGPWYFQPYFFGDNWRKKTGLWGHFNKPVMKGKVNMAKVNKSWILKLGGKSEKTKEIRSITPPTFAEAFFLANPLE